MNIEQFQMEVADGVRFRFGKNWQHFLSVLDNERLSEAERSLKDMLGVETLSGKTFLDVGTGSGLFSLAAMHLGAEHVHSFDYDPQSVACAQYLKQRYYPNTTNWTIQQGSVLNAEYLNTLRRSDIVYSWGVLHHTGDMWNALKNVAYLVKQGGTLFVSIYNDQGIKSRFWRRIKLLYNKGFIQRCLILTIFIPYYILRGFAADIILRRRNPFLRYFQNKADRGMSYVHDWLDWLGGYPFEVAKPADILQLYQQLGFSSERVKYPHHASACNEFVFKKL
jgi:2-polyprenyl-3-methyl-5-hydroxy-6-metoxy-1,4-benzoquinol methylase